jgi:1,4-dihydroxy-2-naphthoyl-CoA hydrolase
MADLLKFEGKIEFDVVEQMPERVVSEMPIQPGVLNPYGVVNAGAILWMADVTATILALGSSVLPTEGMAGFPLAITLNANFISNQKDGTFRAVASFVKKGKKVNVVRTIIYGEKDRLIADVTTNHVPAK